MGLSFSFLVRSERGALDLEQPGTAADAEAIMRELFPRTAYRRTGEQPLSAAARPAKERPFVGAFAGGDLIATTDAHLYDPGILHRRYLKRPDLPDVQLLTSDSVRDMFAYGRWRNGELVRCLSVNATAGVWKDHGTPQDFEGGAPVDPDRWLELCNAALAAALRLEGDLALPVANAVEWESVALHGFEREPRGRA